MMGSVGVGGHNLGFGPTVPPELRKLQLEKVHSCFKVAILLFSVMIVVMGFVSVVLGITVTVFIKTNEPYPRFPITGAGIWAGLVTIGVGAVGVISGHKNANADQLKTLMVFTVIAVPCLIVQAVFAGMWATSENSAISGISYGLLGLAAFSLFCFIFVITYGSSLAFCIMPEMEGKTPCCYCDIQTQMNHQDIQKIQQYYQNQNATGIPAQSQATNFQSEYWTKQTSVPITNPPPYPT
uniref:Uncharacterized LOC100185785 n=1 Tax=Ciona intestinalis TaxID=7719 RepID=F7BH75_CIOIN|nr:uncharacterized protein LOC100185785 [Ciona intestinalis]|eukprot:XP_002122856.1 uncharacterized protein LOC100185785 [Ciona intestinalis]